MHILDYLVLIVYFGVMAGIGFWSMRRVKVQEDFFMGGRGFGKLMQTFAAFGAGTNASGPIATARTTFTSGMSGMWSVMYWLFVTPVYWFSGVWYRRMRHLTLGDWFVERYESKSMGVAYALFGVLYYVIYSGMAFSAIGKIAASLIGFESVSLFGSDIDLEYVLVPFIGVVVLVYGLAGGLQAAYYTDLIQGLCIILLSVILIPFGLSALVERFGDSSAQSMWDGFRILHEQLPAEHFQIVGSNASEFPLYRILAVVVINLIGIVVTPHMIVTGGGSAKTETDARVGLVTGNLLKRLCTIGWVVASLVALALFAESPELQRDPDLTWGIASRELLGPGLTGLMLACLLAALMSSVDAYMLVSSALVVRNAYVPFIRPSASEKECLLVARLTGMIVVAGAVVISLFSMNVFKQLQLTWVFPILFAAVFWTGLFWRRATTTAAWITIGFVTLVFFVLPYVLPTVMDLRTRDDLLVRNQMVETTVTRKAAPSDVARRNGEINAWQEASADLDESDRPAQPVRLNLGDPITIKTVSGGKAIYWAGGVEAIEASGVKAKPQPVGEAIKVDENTTRQLLDYPEGTKFTGVGNLRLDILLYRPFLDLTQFSSAILDTLELPSKIVLPFAVMIICSFLTKRNDKTALDRHYAKMKTPVEPDLELDQQNLSVAYEDYSPFEQRKMFPNSDFELEKPSRIDVIGAVVTISACFGVIVLALWVASLGS